MAMDYEIVVGVDVVAEPSALMVVAQGGSVA